MKRFHPLEVETTNTCTRKCSFRKFGQARQIQIQERQLLEQEMVIQAQHAALRRKPQRRN